MREFGDVYSQVGCVEVLERGGYFTMTANSLGGCKRIVDRRSNQRVSEPVALRAALHRNQNSCCDCFVKAVEHTSTRSRDALQRTKVEFVAKHGRDRQQLLRRL